MAKSTGVYTRVEPIIKEQAEQVLSNLGIPMANAINLFLHQVVLRKGIPFDVRLPQNTPLNYSILSAEQFDTEIKKGMDSMVKGRVVSSAQVREQMKRQYNV
jgi:addiction module RelB/DinJ family antitoxin